MTVYFVAQTTTPTLVKIGQTDDLGSRLQQIAASFEDGVDLLATAPGGRETEAFLHHLFDPERVEGEWFTRTKALDFVIERFGQESRHFGPRQLRQCGDAADEDLKIAVDLLRELLSSLAGFNDGIVVTQERAFKLLHAANPLWTRRRVRALWEARARRIEHYEIRNLESALQLVRRADWAEAIAPELQDAKETEK